MYQKKDVEFYVFLISIIPQEIRENQPSNSNKNAMRFLLETSEKLASVKLKIFLRHSSPKNTPACIESLGFSSVETIASHVRAKR